MAVLGVLMSFLTMETEEFQWWKKKKNPDFSTKKSNVEQEDSLVFPNNDQNERGDIYFTF